MNSRTLVIAATLFVLSCASMAQEGIGLSFYRGSDGSMSQMSRNNAKAMQEYARENGHIDIWLTLNFNYNLYPDLMTAKELEIQRVEVEQGFDEILDSLIAKGEVKHPRAGPMMRGPSCVVRATSFGLRKLLKDDRLIQIVAVNVAK